MTTDRNEHYRKRLIELFDCLKITKAEMADRAALDRSYVTRLFYPAGKAGRKNLGLDTLDALKRAFELQSDWFDLPLGSQIPKTPPVLRLVETAALEAETDPSQISDKARELAMLFDSVTRKMNLVDLMQVYAAAVQAMSDPLQVLRLQRDAIAQRQDIQPTGMPLTHVPSETPRD